MATPGSCWLEQEIVAHYANLRGIFIVTYDL